VALQTNAGHGLLILEVF